MTNLVLRLNINQSFSLCARSKTKFHSAYRRKGIIRSQFNLMFCPSHEGYRLSSLSFIIRGPAPVRPRLGDCPGDDIASVFSPIVGLKPSLISP